MRKYLYILLLLICYTIDNQAQTALTVSDLSVPTLISPYYFGPNAFPVPQMMDGRIDTCLSISLQGDYYLGYKQDHTENINFRVALPLFCNRAALVIWGQAYEWYQLTPERRAEQRLPETVPLTGQGAGDIYLSTDIQILRERRYLPNLTLRAALKTASGGNYRQARFYDAPGYFFDASVGKTFDIRDCSLRLAASSGFLCWQTDNGRQNDAVMYGAMVKFLSPHLEIAETFTGYAGWEKAGDRPMVLQTDIRYLITSNWALAAQYQYGIKDYPYHLFRLSLTYSHPIFNKLSTRQL